MFIPLRTTETPSHFPRATLVWVSLWLATELVSRFWPGSHTEFLTRVAFDPAAIGFRSALGLLFFPNIFSLLVGLLFVWVFSPRVFERRGIFFVLALSLSASFMALWTFTLIHPESRAPLLAPETILGALLGAFMRRDIWGTVSTLVISFKWVRIFEVPSYVLLFFWFFYLFVGNLFLVDPFSNAPMLYWLPFVSFLWGFVWESIWPYSVRHPAPVEHHEN